MWCEIAMRCLRKLRKNLWILFFSQRGKIIKYFRLITNYFLDFDRDKNLKARTNCFSTMKDRCLNYLACNHNIALFSLSWLSYSAFHDASSSNFDGKFDWKFFRFSVRSLQPLFHFSLSLSLFWSMYFVLLSCSIVAIIKLCIKISIA